MVFYISSPLCFPTNRELTYYSCFSCIHQLFPYLAYIISRFDVYFTGFYVPSTDGFFVGTYTNLSLFVGLHYFFFACCCCFFFVYLFMVYFRIILRCEKHSFHFIIMLGEINYVSFQQKIIIYSPTISIFSSFTSMV